MSRQSDSFCPDNNTMRTVGYLDIETTGLSPRFNELTVIGLSVEDDESSDFVQLVGDEIDARRLMNLVKNLDAENCMASQRASDAEHANIFAIDPE